MKHSASRALLRDGPFDGETREIKTGENLIVIDMPSGDSREAEFSFYSYRFTGEMHGDEAIMIAFEPYEDD